MKRESDFLKGVRRPSLFRQVRISLIELQPAILQTALSAVHRWRNGGSKILKLLPNVTYLVSYKKKKKRHFIPVVSLWPRSSHSSDFALTAKYPDDPQKWEQFVWSHKNSERIKGSKIVSTLPSSVFIILELRDVSGKLLIKRKILHLNAIRNY